MIENVFIDVFSMYLNVIIDKSLEAGVNNSTILQPKYGFTEWKNTKGLHIYDPELNVHAVIFTPDASMRTISHECFHATVGLLSAIETTLAPNNEEIFAYLHGFLFEKVYEIHSKNKGLCT